MKRVQIQFETKTQPTLLMLLQKTAKPAKCVAEIITEAAVNQPESWACKNVQREYAQTNNAYDETANQLMWQH